MELGSAAREDHQLHVGLPVGLADCSACLSAGSVRRGVCDICGTRADDGPPVEAWPQESDPIPA
ncbi:MAG TPA: hypothetical protein VF995_04065 [Actinomycetota bacterium]